MKKVYLILSVVLGLACAQAFASDGAIYMMNYPLGNPGGNDYPSLMKYNLDGSIANKSIDAFPSCKDQSLCGHVSFGPNGTGFASGQHSLTKYVNDQPTSTTHNFDNDVVGVSYALNANGADGEVLVITHYEAGGGELKECDINLISCSTVDTFKDHYPDYVSMDVQGTGFVVASDQLYLYSNGSEVGDVYSFTGTAGLSFTGYKVYILSASSSVNGDFSLEECNFSGDTNCDSSSLWSTIYSIGVNNITGVPGQISFDNNGNGFGIVNNISNTNPTGSLYEFQNNKYTQTITINGYISDLSYVPPSSSSLVQKPKVVAQPKAIAQTGILPY